MPHFEIHVSNMAEARNFYGSLFGWDITPMPGGEDVAYHLAEGSDVGMDKGLTVGLLLRDGDAPTAGSPIRGGTLVIEVEDCDERYAWALANGGADAMPPTDFPGVGRCANIEDGQGNVVGILAPAAHEEAG